MSEQRDKAFVQTSIDQGLSSLAGNPFLGQRVLAQATGKDEYMVKKRISIRFILVAVLMLLVTSVALAAGLLFSPKADAGATADRALETSYGITTEMLTYFTRDVAQQPDGTYIVTYTGVSELDHVLGAYTVRVKGDHATAAWSHDGADTSCGLASSAWGAAQLTEVLAIRKANVNNADRSIYEAAYAAGQPKPAAVATSDVGSIVTEEAFEAEQQALARQNKLSLSEMQELARTAICERYQLTNAQIAMLEFNPDLSWYRVEHNVLYYDVCFILTQGACSGDDLLPEYSTMDGQYTVLVNTDTGMIDDVQYESALFGNG